MCRVVVSFSKVHESDTRATCCGQVATILVASSSDTSDTPAQFPRDMLATSSREDVTTTLRGNCFRGISAYSRACREQGPGDYRLADSEQTSSREQRAGDDGDDARCAVRWRRLSSYDAAPSKLRLPPPPPPSASFIANASQYCILHASSDTLRIPTLPTRPDPTAPARLRSVSENSHSAA